MKSRGLIWQIYPAFLCLTILALVSTSWYLSDTVQQLLIERISSELKTQSILASENLKGKLSRDKSPNIDLFCKERGEKTGTRLTVILADGTVIGDSLESPQGMNNHKVRPEVAAALAGEIGSSQRYSTTLNEPQLYIAIPHIEGEKIIASIRTSLSISEVYDTLNRIHWQVGGTAFFVTLVLAIVSLIISRRISNPLEQLRKSARAFARGDFQFPLPPAGSKEIHDLSTAMYDMANQIDSHISEIANQVNEREAIFRSMEEGVIAVDMNRRIIRLNSAAEKMFELGMQETTGTPIQEATNRTDLLEIIESVLVSKTHIEEEIELTGTPTRSIQVHASPLYDAQKMMIGALLVFNDITRIKHLEMVRKEFVANVSHELRTPITAIKGGAETLMGGAIHDEGSAMNFLSIITRQTNRLHLIIEDLLTLSRIEGSDHAPVIEPTDLVTTLEAAISTCRHLANEKSINIDLQAPDTLTIKCIPHLLEQAIINLLTNAINYSEPDSNVEIRTTENEPTCIEVIDQGEGIPQEHLSRIFERFYRVDKARSRNKGGTGLGLSIVKHIVQIHGGEVSVKSQKGEGSTFTITLPHQDEG